MWALLAFFLPCLLIAGEIPVRYVEGRTHGFLVLRDVEDNVIASGGLTQSVNGSRVTTELSFHFKDGSIHQETSVFSQRRVIQLLTYHLIQKGPAFKRPTDMSLTVTASRHPLRTMTVKKTIEDHLKLPTDLATRAILIGNITSDTADHGIYVGLHPKRAVKLQPTWRRLLGRRFPSKLSALPADWHQQCHRPSSEAAPDTFIWMIGGKVPGFLKSEGPLFEGGPVWKIELATPVWPKKQ